MMFLEDFVIYVSIIYRHKNVKISLYYLLNYVLIFISSIFELLVFVFFYQVCQKFVNFIKDYIHGFVYSLNFFKFYISLKVLFVL